MFDLGFDFFLADGYDSFINYLPSLFGMIFLCVSFLFEFFYVHRRLPFQKQLNVLAINLLWDFLFVILFIGMNLINGLFFGDVRWVTVSVVNAFFVLIHNYQNK